MSIAESLYFMYDGISSIDMGIINCSVDKSGMQSEAFFAESEIKEVSTKYNDRPFFQGIIRKPIVLPLQFAFLDTWDDDKLRATARWLCQDYYKEMSFSDNPDIKYYTIANSTVDLVHNSLKQGYLNINFRNIDNYKYSSTFLSPIYDFSVNNLTTVIQFINNGDVDCKPMLSLQKVGNGNIAIINLSDGGKEFGIKNLLNDEDLYIDNENEEIVTSIPNTYRYDNQTGEFLNMVRGVNNLRIFGECKLQFRYQFKNL